MNMSQTPARLLYERSISIECDGDVFLSLRSRREHKAWGVSPRVMFVLK
jgi:hypothetical protein